MKDCKIVQDLMPNYIDNLTSEETNNFIKEHLENCENCTNFYNEMKSKITLESKDTIKQEIDYMKKAKKKMNVGKKLLTIICLLFIILVVLFWREAYNVVCYADICMKYLIWQDAIFEEGGYYEYSYEPEPFSDTIKYYTKDMIITNMKEKGTLTSSMQGDVILNENEYVFYAEREDGKILKMYLPGTIGYYTLNSMEQFPEVYRFDLNNKVSFWDLMSTIGNVRYIWTTKDNNGVEYYVVNLKNDKVVKVNKETGIAEYRDNSKKLIATPSMMLDKEKFEQFIEKINSSENSEWWAYEDFNKDLSEPNNAVSSSNAKAGEIVADTFKIKNEDNTSLNGFFSGEDNNIMYLKITTLTMYNDIKERWGFLRDLTEEDFKHYTVVIVIDKDNTKQIEFTKIEKPEELGKYQEIYIKENPATEDYVYSGIMITVPNNEMYEMKKDAENQDMTSAYPLKIVKE